MLAILINLLAHYTKGTMKHKASFNKVH